MKDVIIKKSVSIKKDEFFLDQLKYKNNRITDTFTKMVLYTADRLFEGNYNEIDPYGTGVILSTRTGPISSIKKVSGIVNRKDYKGINPSLFPNIMLSTALSHLTMFLDIHGPSCAMYDASENHEKSLDYCIVQLRLGNCDSMIELNIEEQHASRGRYIIRKDLDL